MTAISLGLGPTRRVSRDTPEQPDMGDYDIILINSSAGKDSQAMLTYMVDRADAEGVPRDRFVVVHCDLGRVEWEGTRELAEEQAKHYGLRFEVVARAEDLLDQVESRKRAIDAKGPQYDAAGKEKPPAPAWPSSAARYCTSDQKTAQVAKLMTRLVREADMDRPVRILNCLGIRADESPARAKKPYLHRDTASNGKREVTRWLPIFYWSAAQVWERIKESGVRHHPAYDLGMPRLSCVFCVLASEKELVLAARHNPGLAQQYLAVEQRVGSDFKQGLSMRQIVAKAQEAA